MKSSRSPKAKTLRPRRLACESLEARRLLAGIRLPSSTPAPSLLNRVKLFADVGRDGINFTDTVLDDESAAAIASGSAPFTGIFKPQGLLSILDGENPNGTWKLEINDDAEDDAGTLQSWSLTIGHAELSQGTPTATSASAPRQVHSPANVRSPLPSMMAGP